jgi:hypothetical protein
VEKPPLLDAAAVRAAVAAAGAGCPHCAALRCAGWESVAAPLTAPLLEHIGSLRDPAVEEPTLEEHHAEGTGYWSPQAPIATAFFPFNRCEVWRCPQCRRGFLQYTEFGGYYVDHRLRELDPSRVV